MRRGRRRALAGRILTCSGFDITTTCGTGQCGSGENWKPTLRLEGAHSEQWLANEILLPDPDDDDETDTYGRPGVNRSTKRLAEFLTTFELAGLVQMGTETTPGWKIVDGKKQTSDAMEFTTITLLNADGILDAWTARKLHAGRGQGNGGGRK